MVAFEENQSNLLRSSCKWAVFAWKIKTFLNCLKKSKFFGNLPGKVDFFTRIHDPQISNQIDAAGAVGLI